MTLRETKEWIYALARSRRRRTLGVILIVAVAGVGAYGGTLQPFARFPYASVLLAFGVPFALLAIAWLLIRPDRTRHGEVGVVLAIDYETEEEAQLMANDFVREVERRLGQSTSVYRFQIIVPNRLLVPLARGADSAEHLRRLCRAHFVLLADIRTRMVDGEHTRALRLDGLVCHTPIPLETSAALAQEMRQVLPPEHRIACANDLDGFEVTSAFIACASRYVVAVAAMLSQDFEYAISLLTELRRDVALTDAATAFSAIARLRHFVPLRLADSYLARSRQLHNLWRHTRQPEVLLRAEATVEEFNALRPNDPNYSILKAICCFVLRGDQVLARRHLEDVRKQQKKDPTCLYGLAFLDAMQGEMNEAYHHYKKAVSLDSANPATAFEVEEFIEWYLSIDASKVQLHFCLGYLNYKRKGDLLRARKDLESFLGSRPSNSFPTQRIAAAKWLSEIDHIMAAEATPE